MARHPKSLLIENPQLRLRMGEAAWREATEGKFSLQERKRRLKEVLDRATAPEI